MTLIFCKKCNTTPMVDLGLNRASSGVLEQQPVCNSCLGYPAYIADTPGSAAALLDVEVPDRLCAWCLYSRNSPECNFGTEHRYQEFFQ